MNVMSLSIGSAPARRQRASVPFARLSTNCPRPRLDEWLRQVPQAHTVLLQAPAGFGKSAILLQWEHALASSGGCTLRLRCRPVDAHPGRFLERLIEVFNGIGADLNVGVMTDSSQRHAVMERLCVQILATGRPVSLFVDEESTNLAADSLTLLWDLSTELPVRVFLASRRKVTVGLAKARAQGAVAVLNAQEMCFDRSETSLLFAQAGVSLDGEQLDSILERTAGWPLAVRLLAKRGADGPGAAKSAANLAGRSLITDFFAEEVMRQLSADDKSFLQTICILERPCPALCDAVTGFDNGADRLQRLSERGIFLLPIDDGEDWYSLHPLFAAYLKKSSSTIPRRQRRIQHLLAQAWFEHAGLFIEAFDHAMRAGDCELAARGLSDHCDDLYMRGFEGLILSTGARLPLSVRRRFPRIMLAMSWRMMVEWRFEEAAAMLECAEERLEEMRAGDRSTGHEVLNLQQQIKHRRIMQDLFNEDFAAVEREGEILLKSLAHSGDAYTTASLYAAVMYAQREQYRLGSLERLEALAREQLDKIPSQCFHVFFEAMIAPGRFLRGDTDGAVAMLEQALVNAVGFFGRASPMPAMIALTLSEALYARNEMAAAQTLLDEYLPCANEAGFVDPLICGYITQARLQRHQGCYDAALLTLQLAETFAAERRLSLLSAAAFAERIALLCHIGQTDEAMRVAAWHGMNLQAAPAAPGRSSTRADNFRAQAWVRLAHLQGRIGAALGVAKAWRNYTAAAKAVASVVEWDILRAQLLLAAHDSTGAQRSLLLTLSIAAPAHRIRAFVDEATRLAPLFDILSTSSPALGAAQVFRAQVLTAIRLESGELTSAEHATELDESDGSGTADLTARELSILKMAAEGYLNIEIGKNLGLTPGTVKWYLHRIYNKLGCRRRIKAIEQGRRLGLIA
jgi:LuxR family maltose regulon positive regulatory protein